MHYNSRYDIDPKWLPEDPSLGAKADPAVRIIKHRLHWMQWLTYIIVIITCFATLYFYLEFALLIMRLQDAVEAWRNGIEGL